MRYGLERHIYCPAIDFSDRRLEKADIFCIVSSFSDFISTCTPSGSIGIVDGGLSYYVEFHRDPSLSAGSSFSVEKCGHRRIVQAGWLMATSEDVAKSVKNGLDPREID